MKHLIIYVVIGLIVFVGIQLIACYTGTYRPQTNKGTNEYVPFKGTVYCSGCNDSGTNVKNYFHDGGVTTCIHTSSTVTCY